MPTFDHELVVEMVRRRPALARELLRRSGIQVDDGAIELVPSDLSQILPVELRADAVVVLRDEARQPRMTVIVEVQLGIDKRKSWSWPLYVAAARASLRCPALLLVLTPNASIARWAANRIELGHPGHALRPIVIDLGQLPRVTDVHLATQLPELAVLATLAHPEVETMRVALEGLLSLDEDLRELYSIAIATALPPAVRRALEALMTDTSKPTFYDYFPAVKERILSEGRAEGRAETTAELLIDMLVARFGELDQVVRNRIDTAEMATLRQWFRRAVTADSLDAVFAE